MYRLFPVSLRHPKGDYAAKERAHAVTFPVLHIFTSVLKEVVENVTLRFVSSLKAITVSHVTDAVLQFPPE